MCTEGLFEVLGLGCSYVTVANLIRNDAESRTKQGGFRAFRGKNDLMLCKLKGIFQVFSRTQVFFSGKLWFRQSLHIFKANLSKLGNTSAQIFVAKKVRFTNLGNSSAQIRVSNLTSQPLTELPCSALVNKLRAKSLVSLRSWWLNTEPES